MDTQTQPATTIIRAADLALDDVVRMLWWDAETRGFNAVSFERVVKLERAGEDVAVTTCQGRNFFTSPSNAVRVVARDRAGEARGAHLA